MSRFRTNTHRQQVCHNLQLPEILRKKRELTKKGPRGGHKGGFVDLPGVGRPPEKAVRLAPSPPKLLPKVSPTRTALEQMERRLLKLAGALQSQESLLLEMRQKGEEDTPLASPLRVIRRPLGLGPDQDRKRELMQQIFISNRELRERITSNPNSAE